MSCFAPILDPFVKLSPWHLCFNLIISMYLHLDNVGLRLGVQQGETFNSTIPKLERSTRMSSYSQTFDMKINHQANLSYKNSGKFHYIESFSMTHAISCLRTGFYAQTYKLNFPPRFRAKQAKAEYEIIYKTSAVNTL